MGRDRRADPGLRGVRPEVAARAPIEATHYRADDVARELRTLYDRPMGPDTPGRALFMASERTEQLGTCLPSMTLTLNAVRPGEAQRLHRHNAAALVLALHEARCVSTIAGRTFPWTQHVTLLTPAGVEHDHRNAAADGAVTDEDVALSLIVRMAASTTTAAPWALPSPEGRTAMLGLMQDTPLLISGLLDYAERYHPAAEIVSREGDGSEHRYGYAQAAARARQVASALQAAGVAPGDRVATLAMNHHRTSSSISVCRAWAPCCLP